jgi:hypothetical protein
MNDFDLESKLRNARVPTRGEDYWEAFPQRVRAKLRPAPVEWTVRRVWLPRLALCGSIAFACLVIGLGVWCGQGGPLKSASYAIGKTYRMELAQFKNRVRVLLQGEHGLHYLIADQE